MMEAPLAPTPASARRYPDAADPREGALHENQGVHRHGAPQKKDPLRRDMRLHASPD